MANLSPPGRTITRHRNENNGKFAEGPIPSTPKLETEHTGEQQPGRKQLNPFMMEGGLAAYGFGGGLTAWGGSIGNPMGFPGYGGLYIGTPVTYRWMLQHPILRLVRSICIGIIASNVWEYEKVDKSAPDSDADMLKACFNPLRDQLITEFYARARDYGWHSAEPIWESKEGLLTITRLKPLLQDITEVWRDGHGNFLGLKNNVGVHSKIAQSDATFTLPPTGTDLSATTGFRLLPAPYKAWTYAYDSESDYAYGRSWLENVRETAWRDWLDTMQQLQKLGPKISDKCTVIKSPAGTFPGPPDPTNGGKPKQISYKENAEKAISALAAGAAGIWFPSLGLSVDGKGSLDAMKVLVELVNKSVFDIQVLDFGNHAQAISGYIERLTHAEMLMFAGGLRSSRTGMEGSNRGGKADAEKHTDTGTYNAEQDDKDFARGCQPLLDAVLVINRGDKAKGSWRIKPPSLIDRKADTIKAILLALLNNPLISEEVAATLDVDKMIDGMNLDRSKPYSAASVAKASKAASSSGAGKQNQSGGGKANKTTTKKNPSPQGGRTKK